LLGQLLKNVKARSISETRQDHKSTLRGGWKKQMIKLGKKIPSEAGKLNEWKCENFNA